MASIRARSSAIRLLTVSMLTSDSPSEPRGRHLVDGLLLHGGRGSHVFEVVTVANALDRFAGLPGFHKRLPRLVQPHRNPLSDPLLLRDSGGKRVQVSFPA